MYIDVLMGNFICMKVEILIYMFVCMLVLLQLVIRILNDMVNLHLSLLEMFCS